MLRILQNVCGMKGKYQDHLSQDNPTRAKVVSIYISHQPKMTPPITGINLIRHTILYPG